MSILQPSITILQYEAETMGIRGQRTDTIYPDELIDSPHRSLEELYADYRERLLRFVLSKMGGDPYVAEDIVQEAFAAALVSLAGFGARSSPYTWLCAIAQHKIADHYRKQVPGNGSLVDLTAPDNCWELFEDGDFRSSVEQWFETIETRTIVQNALQELPQVYREVLRLKYFDGLSVAEMACRLSRSSKAVEGLLARARQALYRNLTETPPA
jgi:RNA polymerase sigma-70 factor, ECF subfamily